MASTAQFSGIDDSFQPAALPRASVDRASTANCVRPTEFNGPRSGNWTVSSSILGSGIDDDVPTIHHFPIGVSGTPGRVQPIPGRTLDKLARATDDEKKAAAVKLKEARDALEKAKAELQQAENVVEGRSPPPKGFFVPKTDVRGIRIKGENGKSEIVRFPQISRPVPKYQDAEQKKDEAKGRAPSPEPSVVSQSVSSVKSTPSQQRTKTVRIVSRHGEEAFIEVPAFATASRASSVAKEQKPDSPKDDMAAEQDVVKKEKAEKAKRDANAARAVQELRKEREQQNRLDDQHAHQDAFRTSAAYMMSGALPASSPASSVSKHPSMRSAQSSSKSFPAPKSNASKAPSPASSKTSVPAASPKAASVKASPKGFQQAPSIKPSPQQAPNAKPPTPQSPKAPSVRLPARPVEKPLSVILPPPPSPQPPSNHVHFRERVSHIPWVEVGYGETQGASVSSVKSSSRSSSRSSSQQQQSSVKSQQPFGNWYLPSGPPARSGPISIPPGALALQKGSESHGASKDPGIHNPLGGFGPWPESPSKPIQASPSPRPGSFAAARRASVSPFASAQTVFAGQGWISPHPLSEASSAHRDPPEPAIRVPSRDGGQEPETMTYDDWREIQRSPATGWTQERRRNFSATTSSRKSYEAGEWGQLDGAWEEKGGKVQLRMPWDDSGSGRSWEA